MRARAALGSSSVNQWVTGSIPVVPPPSPAEPGIFPSGSSRPFVPGFPLSVLRRFTLCGSSLSLSAILGARSPHPKIPFLADKALAGGCGFVERSHSRRIHDARFAGVRYCCVRWRHRVPHRFPRNGTSARCLANPGQIASIYATRRGGRRLSQSSGQEA